MVVFFDMQQDEVTNYSNFHLSLELSANELHLLLTDKQTNSTTARQTIHLTSNLTDAFNKSEIVSIANPNSVSCAIVNDLFSLIPRAIFSESELPTFLDFNVGLKEDTAPYFTEIENKELIVGFGISKENLQIITKQFPQVQFMHQATVLIQSLSNGLHVNFNDSSSFQITEIKENKLVFYNQYQFESPEEGMYYLGLVAEKLGLDLQKERISISGNVKKEGDILSFWRQFLPEENTIFNEIETSQANVLSTHQYYTLHKQFQCV
ncbi:MAG: DUF3822 family protein [Flavobacteriales bacterium]|nr:DUF3822 family protein [Flavobacteriales bacterium]